MKTKNWMMTAWMAAAVLIAVAGMTGCKTSCCQKSDTPATNAAMPSANQMAQYTCPMHPEVVQDKPGTCPKCGMALTVKK